MKMTLKKKYLEEAAENSPQKESHHLRLIRQVKEVDHMITLLFCYYLYLEPKDHSPGRGQGASYDRLLSSKDLEIKTLFSKLSETKHQLQEMKKENQMLKRLQVDILHLHTIYI